MLSNIEEKDKGFLRDILETFVSSFVILIVIYLGVAFPEVVQGASMEPTLHTGERILVERLSKHFRPYERGDIVVLHPPGDDSVDYVKRVVGLPGEIVKVQDCKVYISTEGSKFELSESYLSENTCTFGGPKLREGRAVRLDENQFFVFGDNRENSADSRVFGVVTEDRILGKVVFRFWPFNILGFL